MGKSGMLRMRDSRSIMLPLPPSMGPKYPLLPARCATQAGLRRHARITRATTRGVLCRETSINPAQWTGRDLKMAVEPPSILVADDEPFLRALIRATLGAGYRLIEARDGAEALDLARERRPSVALIDGQMP